MKPRIQRMDGRWMCWTPSILCSRIVGWGRTPRAAWLDWTVVRYGQNIPHAAGITRGGDRG